MRLAKICTIEAANAFLPSFINDFNQQFAKAPQDPHNAHRPLLETHSLDRVFSLQYKRYLSKSLTLQYNNVIYQVIAPEQLEYTLRKAEVTIIEAKEGVVSIECRGKLLHAVSYHEQCTVVPEVSGKELLTQLKETHAEHKCCRYRPKRPGKHHPWKCQKRGFSKKTLSRQAGLCNA